MANPNNPFGFRPISRLGGIPFSVRQYAKPASDANYAIFAFDMVGKVAAGSVPLEGVGVNIPGIQSGYNLTPGTSLWQGVSINYGAISTLTYHAVADEIDLILIGQAKGTTVISTASHVGKNANVSLTAAGSTTTKQSGMQVDSATIATTQGLDLRIVAVSNIQPNAEGEYAILEVMIQKHELGQDTAGV